MGTFLDFFKMALQVIQQSVPFLTVLLSIFPALKLPVAGLTILNSIPSLCNTAEQLIGDGNGEAKKALVTNLANTAIDTMKKVSTGGQAETWDKISQLVSPAIELAVNNAKIIAATTNRPTEADQPAGP